MTISQVRFASSDRAVKTFEVEVNKAITAINLALDNIVLASDTEAGLIEIAVQSEMETGTDLLKAVAPGRMHYHPGVAKFWSVVTVTAGTHALQASYNVTSITDGAAGIHTVTIATDFSSANWCCIPGAQGSGTTVTTAKVASHSSKTATSVVIATYDLANPPALEDAVSVSVAGYGDHA